MGLGRRGAHSTERPVRRSQTQPCESSPTLAASAPSCWKATP